MIKKISIFVFVIVLFVGCNKNKDVLLVNGPVEIDVVGSDNLRLNDTTKISCFHCLTNYENQFHICFDSVVNESRCPVGVECFWEGYALAKFTLSQAGKSTHFTLSTNSIFPTDTTLDGFRIKLIGLSPYKIVDNQLSQKDYEAEILIQKE